MKIRISADSTCDLSPSREKYDIRIMPPDCDGQASGDGVEITPSDI